MEEVDSEQYILDGNYWFESENFTDEEEEEESILPKMEAAGFPNFTLRDLLIACVCPTNRDLSSIWLSILFLCFLTRFLITRNIGNQNRHGLSALVGVGILVGYFRESFHFPLFVLIAMYILIVLERRYNFHPVTLPLVSMSYLVCGEHSNLFKHIWNTVQNVQMILIMKGISLSIDLRKSKHPFPTVAEYVGYMFFPGNSIFGPWISFGDYLKLYEKKNADIRGTLYIFYRLILALIWFSLSMCFVEWMLPNIDNNGYLIYKKAIEFRAGHYFITYMSEAFSLASGIGYPNDNDDDKEKQRRYMVVCSPWHIEFPRSLTDVAIYWNIPMHLWFRKYIFVPLLKVGKCRALFVTYLVSSLLHGMHFQISAALLTLAFCTYTEYMLRQKIGQFLSACILAKKCSENCSVHKYKSNRWFVKLANFVFAMLAVHNLMYLCFLINITGVNLSLYWTFYRWINIRFYGHVIMFYFFISYLVLNKLL